MDSGLRTQTHLVEYTRVHALTVQAYFLQRPSAASGWLASAGSPGASGCGWGFLVSRSPLPRLSEYGISHLSDNVVLLQFLRGDSELKRAITVLKTRGSAHLQQLRQFDITPDGVTLGEQFDPRQSLL
jgi:hypothetical protein